MRFFLWSLMALPFLFFSCTPTPKEAQQLKEVVYNPKVVAFTSGMVSRKSEVIIRFSEPVAEAQAGAEAASDIMKISPSIKGECYWVDQTALAFRPSSAMASNQQYEVRVRLSKIFPEGGDDFTYQFRTIPQNYRLSVGAVAEDPSSPKLQVLEGTLVLSDYEEKDKVTTAVKGWQEDEPLKIEWQQGTVKNQYTFKVKGIERKAATEEVKILVDGQALDIQKKEEKTVKVFGLKEFEVTEVKSEFTNHNRIVLSFSDPLATDQNLKGLITANKTGIKTKISGHQIIVYFKYKHKGEIRLKVHGGIKNKAGVTLKGQRVYDFSFASNDPKVAFVGKGNIIPQSDGLVIPFKAVSLKAVQLQVIKIYASNVGLFLQENGLSGHQNVKRAGRLVLKRTIPLNTNRSLDLNEWNTFSVDLAQYMEVEPGAIYRVGFKFSRKHTILPCADVEETTSFDQDDEITDQEMAYYDGPSAPRSLWDNYYDYSDYYKNRKNPCHEAYYGSSQFPFKNILASNFGIIAKSGSVGEVVVAVTDLRSTAPQSGIEVTLYNFQHQEITKGMTNKEGLVRLNNHKMTPFLVVASKGDQKGYLRIPHEKALPTSQFNVFGETAQKGLKAFLYGERGVWRPGDTLFVSAIIEDKVKALPAEHPLIFSVDNAKGQQVFRTVQPQRRDHFYLFKVPTDANAPTGNWKATLTVGGAHFDKYLKVETVKPNRLKIKLDFGTDRLTSVKQDINGTMNVKWLHGATAQHLETKMMASLKAIPTRFDNFNDFSFDDPSRKFESESVTFFEGKLDAKGQAAIKGSLHTNSVAPGMLSASFTTRVFEEGGDFSIDRLTIPYSPYANYVGLRIPEGDKRGMLLTGKEHHIDVLRLDDNGKPFSQAQLHYEILKVNWRWWWEQGEDNLARYLSSHSRTPVKEGLVKLTNGKGQIDFQIDYPEWGRYLVRVMDPESGHAAGQTMYVDWPGYANKPKGAATGSAEIMTLSAKADQYNVGEKAEVTFASAAGGRALVSIENGSRVLKEYWVETQKDFTPFSFELTPEMAPNIYVNVTMVQPHQHTENDLPIRMYGLTPILVEDPATRLLPEISMPETLVPEQEFKVRVSEKNGLPMTYNLAVVEDGLLDLTRFKTPKPWDYFYAKEALGVRTWDMYNYVLGAYGGKMEPVLAIGGDGDLNRKQAKADQNRFVPVVKVLGPFTLEAGKEQVHQLRMPQYIGSVRTMVIARHEAKYGTAEHTTPVKQPLMVLATLPRVLGPGEKLRLPVTVFGMEDQLGTVDVKLSVTGPLKTTSKLQQVHFKKMGEQMVFFDLEVAKALGMSKVMIEAKSGNGLVAKHEIAVEVRNPNPPMARVFAQTLQGGNSRIPFELHGMAGTNKVSLEVSSLPAINLTKRMNYLIRYPHGCVEQTTSGVFPQLVLGNFVELSVDQEKEIEKNVKAGIQRLMSFLLPSGGLTYWPGSGLRANEWGTNYAGHFLLEAEKKGYEVPSSFKSKWLEYQSDKASRWEQGNGNNDFVQAYRLFTLSLAQEPNKSAMNRMRTMSGLSSEAKMRLGMAYALTGTPEVAKTLMHEAAQNSAMQSNNDQATYGSALRNQAMALEALLEIGDMDAAKPLILEVAEQLGRDQWYSTQTTAYALLAISKVAKEGAPKSMTFEYALNKEPSVSVKSERAFYQVELAAEKQNQELLIAADDDQLLFARVIVSGVPFGEDPTELHKNLQLRVNYYDLEDHPIEVDNIAQGMDFKAVVHVKNTAQMRQLKDMALTQIFPSGWEIHNSRLDAFADNAKYDRPDYLDIRDDRVYQYFDLKAGEEKSFALLLNASYQGQYYLPSVSCEAMYDREVTARKPGRWIKVMAQNEL
ncbi:alpha-2-macroglobulin family protein [Persicobacter psychrovividus]|uniref:Alpha-2-macroglobulin n=1 Tax=Persicobacter psychrovividus TaxID=387638 RepID=A0ABM7VMG8_9BACT|nr:hypothetical protein PEPS_44880 [Persicobacter psychrovividus]